MDFSFLHRGWLLTGALALDFIAGDPHWFPHPVRGMGLWIAWLEKKLNQGKRKKIKGGLMALALLIPLYFLTHFLCTLSPLVELFLLYTTLALNSLGKEGMKVYRALVRKDLPGARKLLSWLVSRDTAEMDEQEVVRGTVETVSENIVDGIIAPLFWFALGGVPLGMVYKGINTLDSMVGYKNQRFLEFGAFSARLDDLANFLPARLTGFILLPLGALAGGYSLSGAVKTVCRDRLNHPSPNSAHSEAAVAGALGIRLGGGGIYFGKKEAKPFIGTPDTPLNKEHIKKGITLMRLGTILFALFLFLFFHLQGGKG